MNEPHISEHLAVIADIEDKILRIDDMQKIPDYFFSENYKDTWIFYLRKLILNRIYSQAREIKKKIIIKEPSYADASDVLLECLPRSKMIMLIWDGRDALDSVIDARTENGFMTLAGYDAIQPPTRLNFIKIQSKLWADLMQRLMITCDRYSNKEKCWWYDMKICLIILCRN